MIDFIKMRFIYIIFVMITTVVAQQQFQFSQTGSLSEGVISADTVKHGDWVLDIYSKGGKIILIEGSKKLTDKDEIKLNVYISLGDRFFLYKHLKVISNKGVSLGHGLHKLVILDENQLKLKKNAFINKEVSFILGNVFIAK